MEENMKLVKDVKQRFEQVQHRLSALTLEINELTKERDLLCNLLKLYKNRDYDSIYEERRVTTGVLNDAEQNNKRLNLIEQVFLAVATINKETSISDIYNDVCKLSGEEVNIVSVRTSLHALVKQGKIQRCGKGRYKVIEQE